MEKPKEALAPFLVKIVFVLLLFYTISYVLLVTIASFIYEKDAERAREWATRTPIRSLNQLTKYDGYRVMVFTETLDGGVVIFYKGDDRDQLHHVDKNLTEYCSYLDKSGSLKFRIGDFQAWLENERVLPDWLAAGHKEEMYDNKIGALLPILSFILSITIFCLSFRKKNAS